MLKIMLKTRQNNFMHTRAVNSTEKACPYYCQHQQPRNNDYNKHVINQQCNKNALINLFSSSIYITLRIIFVTLQR